MISHTVDIISIRLHKIFSARAASSGSLVGDSRPRRISMCNQGRNGEKYIKAWNFLCFALFTQVVLFQRNSQRHYTLPQTERKKSAISQPLVPNL